MERKVILQRRGKAGAGSADELTLGIACEDEHARYTRPMVEVELSGKRKGSNTVITNFGAICQALERHPDLVAKYISTALGTRASVTLPGTAKRRDRMKACAVKVKGAHSVDTLEDVVVSFTDALVLCPACDKPETRLTCAAKSKRRSSSSDDSEESKKARKQRGGGSDEGLAFHCSVCGANSSVPLEAATCKAGLFAEKTLKKGAKGKKASSDGTDGVHFSVSSMYRTSKGRGKSDGDEREDGGSDGSAHDDAAAPNAAAGGVTYMIGDFELAF